MFGICLAATALSLTGSVLPVVLLAVRSVFCFYLALKHNTRPVATPPQRPLPPAVVPAQRGAVEEPVGVGVD